MAAELPKKKMTEEELNSLELEYYELMGSDDDDAKARAREIRNRIRRAGSHVRCGNELTVEVDIPLGPHTGPDGSRRPVMINGKPYAGKMTLPECTVREVMRILDQAWREDADRMQDNGYIRELPPISGRVG